MEVIHYFAHIKMQSTSQIVLNKYIYKSGTNLDCKENIPL